MFKLNPEGDYDDVYENILEFNKKYLDDKTLMTNNYLNSFVKLEKIYKALVGGRNNYLRRRSERIFKIV